MNKRFPAVMPLYARHDRTHFSVEALLRLASFPSVVLDWNDEVRKGWAPEFQTPGAYLRRLNSSQVQLAYIPAGYWWSDRSMSEEAAPHRVRVQRALEGKYMGGTRRVEPWPGQPLLSSEGVGVLEAYILEHFNPDVWDGIHFDVLLPEFWHLGGGDDGAVTAARLREMVVRVREKFPDVILQGNGSWEPLPDGSCPYRGLLDGAMVERFPTYPAYDAQGRQYPPLGERFAWHMSLGESWPGEWYSLHDDGLDLVPLFKERGVKSVWQGRRLVLAAACILGCWYTPPLRYGVPWMDELVVVGGSTRIERDGVGWLGGPVGPAGREGLLWRREFENGLVLLNGEDVVRRVDVGGGWRRVRGWYDRATNSGELVSGPLALAPLDAVFLWRDGAPRPEQVSASALVRASLRLHRAEVELEEARREWRALVSGGGEFGGTNGNE